MYSALMIPVGLLPYIYQISGIVSMWIVLGCNLFMLFVSVLLFIRMDVTSARRVMFSSYFYLMIVFLSLFANKVYKSDKHKFDNQNIEVWKQR
jgi:protoheme IX farnesyltransferase